MSNNSTSILDQAKPIIDTKGVDMTLYETDLEECNAYSDDVSITRSIAKGSATGAAVGAVIEAISDRRKDAIEIGAVTGGTQSGLRAAREKEQILKQCLKGRGYKVLN
ncbi:MAG: glycine zipper family protein [Gammaproteobacteria bacterium]|nr:glycine zipper family protein [Gammaproteobacteria bacterium]